MNIGVDLRNLLTSYRTGVGEYTVELLNAVFNIDYTNKYFLFYNSYKDASGRLPKFSRPNVYYVPTRIPNKLLNAALLFTGRPKLDRLVARYCQPQAQRRPADQAFKLDYFFSPTLNYSSVSPATKNILTVHDISFEFFPEFFTPRQRVWHRLLSPKRQCEQAAIILTPSENTKRDIVDYYKIPAEKIKVIYPGLSELFNNGLAKSKEEVIKKYNLPEKYILFLGTVEPRKNILNLIKAFEHAYPLLPTPYSLVIAGGPGWKNKAVYHYAATAKLRDKIKFIGYVPTAEKPAIYAAAALFVYPSFYEGFGFPVLEAMAMGVPVITSNRSSLCEITGASSYLVNPDKPGEIALGMERLLQSQALSARAQKNGLNESAKFSWHESAKQWLAAIGYEI